MWFIDGFQDFPILYSKANVCAAAQTVPIPAHGIAGNFSIV